MLLRQTLLYLPAQVLGPASQVLAALVWTHWLAPGPYGLLTFLLASQDLVFLTCVSWWTHYAMRYAGGLGPGARDGLAASEPPVLALTGFAQVAVTLGLLATLREPVTPGLVASACACAVTRSTLTHLGERARTAGAIGLYTLGQIGGSVGGFLLALIALTLAAPTLAARPAAAPDVVLWGYAAAQAGCVAALARGLGLRWGRLTPERAVLRASLRYGAPLLVAGGLAWLAQNGIRFVVEVGAGAPALGLVAVGWGLGQRLAATLSMLVVAASFPLAVRDLQAGSRLDAYRRLSHGGVLLMALVMPATVGLCLLARPFATLAVAEPFRAATVAVLPAAALAGAVRNIRMHLADPVFLLLERPAVNIAIALVDAVAVVAGCALGLRLGGLDGAVTGCLAGSIVGAGAAFALAKGLGDFAPPLADAGRLAAASAVMALALVAIPWERAGLAPLARLIGEAAAGSLVYGLCLAALYPALVGRALGRATPRTLRP